MTRYYKYKIQWLFYVSPNFFTSVKELKKEFYSVLKCLGPKSLDKIIFRDCNLKIISRYTFMGSYPSGSAFRLVKKDIENILKKDNRINSIEIIKK